MKNATTQTSTVIEHPKTAKPGNNTTSSHDVFHPGCIVSINGCNLDFGKYQSRKNSPIFYGAVEDHKNNDRKDNGDLIEDELIVTFVVSREYGWYDKNDPNVLHNNYSKNVLTVCTPPPSTVLVDVPSYDDEHFTKWFTKTSGCWVVKKTQGSLL